MKDNSPTVVIDRITKTFGEFTAVNELSLSVHSGRIFGLIGPNGAGKTTTIHLLLGLLEATSGEARVLGLDPRTQSEQIRARCGALLEFSGLYERLTAEDNLDFYGRVWHMPPGERQARIKELLTHLALYDRRRERVSTWSRGMKQKLAIARVLLHRPDLIFLDEPTAGLDPVAAAALRDDLEALVQREGTTVFLNTHNLPEAERLCQQVGVIREGRLSAVGSPDMLRQQTGHPQAEIVGEGFTPEVMSLVQARPDVESATIQNGHLIVNLRDSARAAPIVTALVGAGVQIEEVRRGQASLEDVFMTLMQEGER